MNAQILPASDRRAPRARDADTLERFFHDEPDWAEVEAAGLEKYPRPPQLTQLKNCGRTGAGSPVAMEK